MRLCPICDRDNHSVALLAAYSLAPWELKCCAGCGLVYLVNPPEYVRLEEEFAWEKTWIEESAKRWRRNPLLYSVGHSISSLPKRLLRRDKLGKWVRRFVTAGPVLDIGCGTGVTLERLPWQYIPFGVEISKGQAKLAHARVVARGGRVEQADALAGMKRFQPGLFTGVIMNSYLEHEINPRAVLQSARALMQPKARLIVKVPNFGSCNRIVRGAHWCGFRYPDHVNYFTPSLLVRLLGDAGYHVLRAGFYDHLPTSDNMWMLAEKI